MKDGKVPIATKLLPTQTTAISTGAPQQNGLLAKPATVAISTASPTTVASAIPVVQKGSHFHVQPGVMAPAGSVPAPRFTHVFPSNALTKVGVMTVPTLQGSIARVPFQMTASTSAPLLVRNQAHSVSKVLVSTPSESSQEMVNPQQQGSEQDRPSEETKTAEKSEVSAETKTEELKREESNIEMEEKITKSSESENVPNFLDDVDSLNTEKKLSKSEPQLKDSKSKTVDSDKEKEKDENSAPPEENICMVPLTVQNLEEDQKKKTGEKKTQEKKETKPSEKTAPEITTEKDKSVVEVKQEPQTEEEEKSVEGNISKEEKKTEGESKKSNKEDFDPVGAMDWKDGVGELEGSNLKVRYNFCRISCHHIHCSYDAESSQLGMCDVTRLKMLS
jgi:hypothetical protein